MTDTQLIYTINQNKQMKRQFHSLPTDKRRMLIKDLDGQLNEKAFRIALRRVKKEN